VTILRPPVVFGSRDRMLGIFFKAVQRGRAIVWGDGSNAFNAVHAPDVASAVVLSLARPHPTGSILYTSDDRTLTWRSFIETLDRVISAGTPRPRRVSVMGMPPAVFTVAAALSTAQAFVTRGTPSFSFDKIRELREKAWICTSRETQELLGWTPSTTIEDALARTHDWYRRAGLL
jgi:nucleoside-diphosphate-sugar epimerase